LHFPLRYVWRRERPDSGGPGEWRGGTGADNVYVLHHAGAQFVSTAFAHGVLPPTSTGVAGGEPGFQNGFAVVRGFTAADVDRRIDEFGGTVEWLPPKKVTALGEFDAFANYCQGGGGIGDPLLRPVDRVRDDVLEGVVSRAGARRDYGVVLSDDGAVDLAATDRERAARRAARIAPRSVRPGKGTAAGRRLSSTVVVAGSMAVCRLCGHEHGPATDDVKQHLVLAESSAGYRWAVVDGMPGAARFVVRRFYCPGCAVQVDVEVNFAGLPPYRSAFLF
jgi:N-methylhydantoinase B